MEYLYFAQNKLWKSFMGYVQWFSKTVVPPTTLRCLQLRLSHYETNKMSISSTVSNTQYFHSPALRLASTLSDDATSSGHIFSDTFCAVDSTFWKCVKRHVSLCLLRLGGLRVTCWAWLCDQIKRVLWLASWLQNAARKQVFLIGGRKCAHSYEELRLA